MGLAQEDYPNPQEYQDKEKLILDYTFATGGTAKIKKILEYLKDQELVTKRIVDKAKTKDSYEI